MGSGTTAVAAVRNDRRYVGFEMDPAYVALAEERIATAVAAGPIDIPADAPDDPAAADA